MRFVRRQDGILLAVLGAALVVGLATPIRSVLDFSREVEQRLGLALLPAFIILTVGFVFHLQSKRQEARALRAAADAEQVQAEARALEMKRLVAFGQALGRSLDLDAIRDVVYLHFPRLAGTDDAWILWSPRPADRWKALLGSQDAVRDSIAERALARRDGAPPGAVSIDGHVCIPLTSSGETVGVLAVPERAGPFTESRQHTLAAAAMLIGISIRNAQLFREVRENSVRDGLTGCFNRTHFLEAIDTELRRARRSHMPISLIMFDLDHFKTINDRHGHLCGDAVLAAVGARMRAVLRGNDLKCRYGGEEFMVLLPDTPLDGARRAADTLCRELAEMTVQWKGQAVQTTASFGVTAAQPSDVDSEALIGRADAALYLAKDQGRNCVRQSSETVIA